MNVRKIAILDLDGTLWNFHSGYTPYKSEKELKGLLFPEVEECLELMKLENIPIAIASASPRKDFCVDYLQILFPEIKFDFICIQNTSKKVHFQKIKEHFEIDYSQMYFFDDQENFLIEARSLGINSIGVKGGLKVDVIKKQLID